MQQAITFRVRDYGSEASALQALEDLLRGARNQHIGEFHQEIIQVIDGVFGGIGQGVLNVLQTQMEIAAAVNAGQGTDGCLQFFDFPGDQLGLEGELVVGVGRGDDIGGAGFGRQAQHGDGLLDGVGAIVETPEDMAMDIDHF